MEKTISAKFDEKALTYHSYLTLLNQLLTEGKTTGAYQSPELTEHARLNIGRMQNVMQTVAIVPEIKEKIAAITGPQTWYVLTEGWCGDAAQSIPVMHAIAQLNPNITFKLLLRDENPDIMDCYLQYGKSRSIPKLIVYCRNHNRELFNWGPRPVALQEIYDDLRESQAPFEIIADKIHSWYAEDKTHSIQQELFELL
ncbi:thioredoxin family protein [Deminuibacter soli]|uniref:Thioredoxin family protein n=1 Tax=Deminuibacter soli TaxID=2291815 RepID=A0A3E1NFD9_9BACT|nr:thioredoxin family protein [Deminuibacter soli]RFM26679.1 thioredoxin family protein [Deminuibacter soli]